MHIAIFTDFHSSTLGGVQTSITAQVDALRRLGHHVTIVCPAATASTEHADIELPTVPFIQPNGFPLVAPTRANRKRIIRALAALPPVDIVHAQTTIGVGIMGVLIARQLNVPLMQSLHGREDILAEKTYPIAPVTSWLASAIHRWFVPHKTAVNYGALNATRRHAWDVMVAQAQAANHVVVPSHHFMRRVQKRGVTVPITPISNGLTDDTLAIVRSAQVRRYQSSRPLRFIWWSRMSAEKNPLTAIDAVRRVDGVQLAMYGDGSYLATVREYIAKHHLEDKITLKGSLSQAGILAAALDYDAMIFSSYNFDTQSIVLLEAVAAGLPVVYCDPDLAETVPATGALLATSPDGEGLARAIETLVNRPRHVEQMSKAMLAHREQTRQLTHTKNMIKLYKDVIQRYRAR